MKLIYVFVFAYAKSRFSHDAAHLIFFLLLQLDSREQTKIREGLVEKSRNSEKFFNALPKKLKGSLLKAFPGNRVRNQFVPKSIRTAVNSYSFCTVHATVVIRFELPVFETEYTFLETD